MRQIFEIKYTISDRGINYPDQLKEVIVNDTIINALEKELRKYRRAMNLSNRFTFEITNSRLTGYCK